MLISLLLLTLITLGGMSLTYLVTDDEPLMWRLAAGNVIGSAVFGLVAFASACIFGFGAVTIIASLVITMLPLLILRRRDYGLGAFAFGYSVLNSWSVIDMFSTYFVYMPGTSIA